MPIFNRRSPRRGPGARFRPPGDAGGAGPRVARPAGGSLGDLEADIVPLPIPIDSQPDARPVVVLVISDHAVVGEDLLTAVAPDAESAADALAAVVRAVIGHAGDGRRRRVTVRHAVLVKPLTERLADLKASVGASHTLPGIDDAASHLRARLGLPPVPNLPMMVATWKAWGLPDLTVTRLFQAAANYAQAAPWRFIQNAQTLVAAMPGGRVWHTCVLGNGGEMFGLSLYSEKQDLDRQFEGSSLFEGEAPKGTVITLTLEPIGELPPLTAREIRGGRLPIADEKHVPYLMVTTPWAGIAPDQADDLVAVLRAVPAFASAHQALLSAATKPPRPIRWQDLTTGVELTYSGLVGRGAKVPLWPTPAVLSLGCAQGPAADPEAALTTADDVDALAQQAGAWLERFAAWCQAHRVKGSAAADSARGFVEAYLVGYVGVPLVAVTDPDLRMFLFDWFPRKVACTWRSARTLPQGLATFFAFMAEAGIVCPWAEAILADKAVFETRFKSCPGHAWWDPGVEDWRIELSQALDRLVFIPDERLGRRDRWGDTLGPDEHALRSELSRRWLLWRDEVIGEGTTAADVVRRELVHRQRAWEQARHPAFRGRTPVDVVLRERRRQGRSPKRL